MIIIPQTPITDTSFEKWKCHRLEVNDNGDIYYYYVIPLVEVDEDEMLISLYSYVPIPVPDKLIGALGLAILNINPETRYGCLEICTTENEEGETEHFLRYRAATYLRGIKSGKVEAIESMVTNGSEFFGLALDAMCVNKSIKKWLLS